MTLAAGKKRYNITLTQLKFEELQAMIRELGLPKGTESVMIDDFIAGMVDKIGPVLLKIKKSGKTPSLADYLIMMGKVMEDAEADDEGKA